ncbi:MAG: hypothetical protein ABW252_19810 [Polyangiales bacterium]
MRDLVIWGVGELGRLYGGAALRAGVRVTPITRESDPARVLAGLARDVPILVAVGESSLDEVLAALPQERATAPILLQNDLFPSRWTAHRLEPTVIVAWLLKKRGTELTVARSSPVFGRHAALVLALHEALGAPAHELPSASALNQALIEKYAFILGINALGLTRDRTLSGWMQEDPLRVRALTTEAATLGAALCGSEVERAAADRAIEEAWRALGTMSARGRTAGARVRRALTQAHDLGLRLPELERAAREASA